MQNVRGNEGCGDGGEYAESTTRVPIPMAIPAKANNGGTHQSVVKTLPMRIGFVYTSAPKTE